MKPGQTSLDPPSADRSDLRVRRGETIKGRVTLDDTGFIDCRFQGATLVYSGVGLTQISGCSFQDVRFEFVGPAGNTLTMLKAMAAPESGLKDVVKASFPQIFAH